MQATERPKRHVVAAIIVLIALLSGGPFLWKQAERMVRPGHSMLATFTEASVRVAIAHEYGAGGTEFLLGTFTPLRQGFHLYSTKLPREGINGVGRPTLLEVAPGGPLAEAGPAVADRPPESLYVPTLGDSFPVYSAGPVTLRVPVRRTGEGRRATLEVTYMACDDRSCLAPVAGRQVEITLPR